MREALALAPVLEATRLHSVWAVLALASARFSPVVTVLDPVTHSENPLTLATILVGPHGRWHEAVKRFMWSMARECDIPLDQSDTGGERAGAVAILRRFQLNRMTTEGLETHMRRDIRSELEASVGELCDFSTEGLVARIPKQPKNSVFHVPSELTAFLQANRPELYHHIYSGLQQETMAHSQKNESYYLPNMSLTLAATATQDTMRLLFPESNIYLKHLARFSVVYAGMQAKWNWRVVDRPAALEARAALKGRLEAEQVPVHLELSQDAYRHILSHRDYAGIGAQSKQLEAYQATRSNHLLRLAGLVALLRDKDSLEINLNDIKTAEVLLSGAEENLQAIYLNVSMGLPGRILAIAGEAARQLEFEGKGLSYNLLLAYCMSSGFQAEVAKRGIDQLLEAQLLITDERNASLRPIYYDSSLTLTTLLKRIGLTEKLNAFS